jgi:DNA-binding CsgD family transcriptional regulator
MLWLPDAPTWSLGGGAFIGSIDDICTPWEDDLRVSDLEPVEGRNLSFLSPREREVFDVAIEGLSARDMARRLSLSEATVRSHLAAIYSKLGVTGRVELLASLNGALARNVPSQEPEVPGPGPKSDASKPTRRVLTGAAVLVLIVFATTAFLAVRPDLPPRADLATVSRLLAANDVTLLDLRGETLTLTERSGERLRVDGVTYDSFQPLELVAISRSVTISESSDPSSLTTELGMIATSVLPLLLLGVVLLLVVRAIRRPPRVRPAG